VNRIVLRELTPVIPTGLALRTVDILLKFADMLVLRELTPCPVLIEPRPFDKAP